ncbi:MAG: AbrB/MazE/SpoVT family DNA-binding domain-containing protein [Thermosphaera sp.]
MPGDSLPTDSGFTWGDRSMALTTLSFITRLDKRSAAGVVGFMPTMARTRVGRYYRMAIPREVRRLLELRENDEVEWVFENGVVYVKRARGGQGG